MVFVKIIDNFSLLDDSLNIAGMDDKSTSSPKLFRKKPNKSVAPSPPSKLPNSNFSRPHPQQQLQYQQMTMGQLQSQAQNYQFDSQNFLAQETANNSETEVSNEKEEISVSDDEKIKQIENELQQFNSNNNIREETTTPTPVPVPRPMPIPSPRVVLTTTQKSDGETQTPTTTIKPNLPEKPVIPKRPNLNNLLYTKDENARNSLGTSPTNVFRYSREFKEIPFIDTPTDSDQENHVTDSHSFPENSATSTSTTPMCKPRTPTSGGTLKRPQVPAPPPPSITPTPTSSTATAILHSSD